MRAYRIVLLTLAPIFLLVAALHLLLGVGADVLLGATIPGEYVADPALDSQNRFYGVAFSVYGALLALCATDLPRYAPVLRLLLLVFFAAGLARLVSLAIVGQPPALVLALTAIELIAPPLLWLAYRHLQSQQPTNTT